MKGVKKQAKNLKLKLIYGLLKNVKSTNKEVYFKNLYSYSK